MYNYYIVDYSNNIKYISENFETEAMAKNAGLDYLGEFEKIDNSRCKIKVNKVED